MAKKVVTTVELTDDLDGGRADQTVSFSFDGASYEIDLSKRNVNAFAKVMKPYLDHARKARAGRGRASRSARPKQDLSAIRAWAHEAGIEVSDRGRIAQTVVDQYNASH